jgi:protease-4
VKYAKAVAVVELAGEIIGGGDSRPGETIAPLDTCEMLDEIASNERIKAVVLRIDSPGGDANASDRIHHAVRRLTEKKPVVALFDGVAASGGYYIGCAADEIQVHRATITGSIGVFALVPNASAALDLLGVHRHSVSTGPRAETMSVTAPFTSERQAALLQVIEDVDRRFQGLVASRRKIDAAKVHDLAGGRVYIGEQAVANGLADGFGTLSTAVAAARKRAGIEETLPLEVYPRERGLLARLGMGGAQTLLPYAFGQQFARLQRLAQLRGVQVQALAGVPTVE